MACWHGKSRADIGGRALKHAKVLLDLINTFPRTNPTPISDPNKPTPQSQVETAAEAEPEVDLGALLSNIRARYKLLCTSLGVRPRLVAAPGTSNTSDGVGGEQSMNGGGGGMVVEGIEGPMKGVDTSKLRF